MTENRPRPQGGFDLNPPTIVALLYLAGALVGVTVLIGLILAYVWRKEPLEGWEKSHFDFHIRTFWWSIVFTIVSFVLSIILIGLVGFMLVGLWALIRTVVALVAAQKRAPLPRPHTLLW